MLKNLEGAAPVGLSLVMNPGTVTRKPQRKHVPGTLSKYGRLTIRVTTCLGRISTSINSSTSRKESCCFIRLHFPRAEGPQLVPIPGQ